MMKWFPSLNIVWQKNTFQMYLEGCSGLSFKKISCLQRWSAVPHLWWDIRYLWCTEMSVPISDSSSFKLSEQSDLFCFACEVQTLGCNSMPNMLSRIVSRMTEGPYIAKQSPLEWKKVEQEVPNLLWQLKDFFPHDSIKISGTFTHSPDSTKPFCSVRSKPLTEKILNWASPESPSPSLLSCTLFWSILVIKWLYVFRICHEQ